MQDVGVDGGIILKLILKIPDGYDTYWPDVAEDTDRRRVLVNAAMNLRVL